MRQAWRTKALLFLPWEEAHVLHAARAAGPRAGCTRGEPRGADGLGTLLTAGYRVAGQMLSVSDPVPLMVTPTSLHF